MPDYVCTVGSVGGGAVLRRVLSAESPTAARHLLEDQGLAVFEVRRRAAALRVPKLGPRRPAARDFLVVNREFAALIRAGMPVLQALTLLQQRRSGSRLGDLLTRVSRRLEGGASLAEAFAAEEDLVSPLYVTTVAVGEASGDLEGALRRYTAYLERVIELRKRLVGALAYPAILVGLSLGVVGVLLTYVMPRFAEFYASYNAQLPWLTRALLATSSTLSNAWPLWLAAAVVIAVLAVFWLPSPVGRAAMARFVRVLPGVGGVQQRYVGVQLTRTLAVLLRGGTPVVAALEATRRALSNPLYRDRLGATVEAVRAGAPLYRALEDQDLLGAMAIEMIEVGESAGELDSMLDEVADYYDEALDAQLRTAVSMLEPMLMLTVGLVIAMIVLAVYLPLFNVVQAVR